MEYEPLPVVLDPEEALKPDACLLHEEVGSNAGNHRTFEFGDPEAAFAEAGVVVVEERLKLHRYSSTPIETYGVIADYDEAEDSFEEIAAKTDIPKHRLTAPVILHNRVELNAWLMDR